MRTPRASGPRSAKPTRPNGTQALTRAQLLADDRANRSLSRSARRLLPLSAWGLAAAPTAALISKCQTMNNFRDLAGTPVRGATAQIKPGLILRSATPADCCQADADAILAGLPGVTVLDLRSEGDALKDEGARPLSERTRHVEMLPKKTATKRLTRHVLTDRWRVTYPLLPARIMRSLPIPGVRSVGRNLLDRGIRRFLETIELSDVYWWILSERGDALQQCLVDITAAGAAGEATLVHCAHGKDRTGVLCAVLLHACGASLEQIAADYALSDEWGCSPMGQDIMLQAMPERYRDRIKEWNTPPESEDAAAWENGFWWAQFGKWCGAQPGTMEAVFARVEKKYGSMDAYLDSIDFDASKRAALQEALTCPL